MDDKIEISVKDNGNGIPQKILDKIFQPFFTTKPTGQGTGLGLSLSYDIVKAHGGEIKVETRRRGRNKVFSLKSQCIICILYSLQLCLTIEEDRTHALRLFFYNFFQSGLTQNNDLSLTW